MRLYNVNTFLVHHRKLHLGQWFTFSNDDHMRWSHNSPMKCFSSCFNWKASKNQQLIGAADLSSFNQMVLGSNWIVIQDTEVLIVGCGRGVTIEFWGLKRNIDSHLVQKAKWRLYTWILFGAEFKGFKVVDFLNSWEGCLSRGQGNPGRNSHGIPLKWIRTNSMSMEQQGEKQVWRV